MTRLFIVRHGESDWNHSGRYQGQIDTSLSELGRRQALLLADRLAAEHLDGILSSPLRRALDTATTVASERRITVQIEPGLTEIDHGDWSGLMASQVAARYPEALRLWIEDPARVVMPKGESLADVARRAIAVVDRLLSASKQGSYLLCSHDVPLRLILLRAQGLDYSYFWQPRLDNASITLVEFGEQGSSVLFTNDTAHLLKARSALARQAL